MVRYTISARSKRNDVPILDFLRRHFPALEFGQIDSVFGFVEPTTLYGGRIFTGRELTPLDVADLYNAGIGVRLPLTNHFAAPDEYERSAALLRKYHKARNAVIVTNDDLAKWIRRDFPLYRIEASVIKNLKTRERIEEAMDLYDTVVLPMELNDNTGFLEQLTHKDRITLFANAGCALTCPSKICYMSVSKVNKGNGGEFMCSQPLKQRDMRGMVDFDLGHLQSLGFSRFKLLRSKNSGMTGF